MEKFFNFDEIRVDADLLERSNPIFNEKTVKAVCIDCANLQYISSAGLRVLFIMKKNSEDGVFLENVSPQIMEILETTGFDSIFFGTCSEPAALDC